MPMVRRILIPIVALNAIHFGLPMICKGIKRVMEAMTETETKKEV